MNIGSLNHAGLVEGAQKTARADRVPPVGGVENLDGRAFGRHDCLMATRCARLRRAFGRHDAATAPTSSRSDKAVTRVAGGAQLNTPARWPSTTGVAGPHMPRRNRYSTPPRCRAGS